MIGRPLVTIPRRWLAAALVALGCAGCAGTPPVPEVPPKRQLSDVAKPDEALSRVFDPIEGWNRGVYKFNAQFDRYVFLPAVDAYRFVTPEFVRDRIHDFFSNLNELTTFVNAVLQLKGETAGRAAVRFVNNVMFGFGGLYDITAANGIAQVREDFGQTLGYWGAGPGPYLVLPLYGPSNVRDATGLVVDEAGWFFLIPGDVSSSPAYMATSYVLRPIDLRSSIPFRYYRSGSPFEYDLVRVIYTRYREALIAR